MVTEGDSICTKEAEWHPRELQRRRRVATQDYSCTDSAFVANIAQEKNNRGERVDLAAIKPQIESAMRLPAGRNEDDALA